MKGIIIHTNRLTIREFLHRDSAELYKLYRKPETSRYESWDPFENEKEANDLVAYWIDQQKRSPRTSYTFAIAKDSQFIGLIGLEAGFSVETPDDLRTAFAGFRIDPAYWGKGYATEALLAVLKLGFSELGLRRVHAGTVPENPASVRVLIKAGFQHEGTTRKSFPVNKTWHDYQLFGILREEFE